MQSKHLIGLPIIDARDKSRSSLRDYGTCLQASNTPPFQYFLQSSSRNTWTTKKTHVVNPNSIQNKGQDSKIKRCISFTGRHLPSMGKNEGLRTEKMRNNVPVIFKGSQTYFEQPLKFQQEIKTQQETKNTLNRMDILIVHWILGISISCRCREYVSIRSIGKVW